jgi:hypothetical protein
MKGVETRHPSIPARPFTHDVSRQDNGCLAMAFEFRVVGELRNLPLKALDQRVAAILLN